MFIDVPLRGSTLNCFSSRNLLASPSAVPISGRKVKSVALTKTCNYEEFSGFLLTPKTSLSSRGAAAVAGSTAD